MAGSYTGGSQALQFFFTILGAAYDRATTAEVWAALNDASEATGVPLTGITIQDINQLRASAGDIVRAAGTLANAPGEYAIDAGMIGNWPSTQTGPGTGLDQSYIARFGYDTVDANGNVETNYVSVFFDQLPETVDQLQASLQGEAMGFAEAYNTSGAPVTVSGVSQIQLTTV